MGPNPGFQPNMQGQQAAQQAQQAQQNSQRAALQAAQQAQQQVNQTNILAQQSALRQRGQKKQKADSYLVDDRFANVGNEVARLNQELAAGRISQGDYNNRLKDMMVKDDAGAWWTVGANSQSWYRFDGQNWAQATPPGQWVQGTPVTGFVGGSTQGHPVGAIFLFVFLAVIVLVAAGITSYIIDYVLQIQGISIYAFLLVLGIGLFMSLRRAIRTWRGY